MNTTILSTDPKNMWSFGIPKVITFFGNEVKKYNVKKNNEIPEIKIHAKKKNNLANVKNGSS